MADRPPGAPAEDRPEADNVRVRADPAVGRLSVTTIREPAREMEDKPVSDKHSAKPQWLEDMKRFEKPSVGKAAWQLANTFIPYVGLWVAMYFTMSAGLPYVVTLALSVVAAFFLVRLFIFFHDACHGSYFKSDRANRYMGRAIGVLTFTSFDEFRHSHGIHHSTAGNLDRRGVGDVWTMTVQEYQQASRRERISYRVYRHPLILFVIGPISTFLVTNRIPVRGAGRRLFWSVMLTNVAIAGVALVLGFSMGWLRYLAIQLPVILISGSMGIWLFYVQHQFDPSYWARSDNWGRVDAALRGSSHYRLPKVLQWASGNIGLHHIHHLRPRIPNYNLPGCLVQTPEVHVKNPLTVRRSLSSIRMNLWDEVRGRLVSFSQVRQST